MSERDHPTERDGAFEHYLSRTSQVSQRYREMERDEPDADVDRAVIAQARTAVRRRSWTRWSAPLAVAASALIVLSIVVVPEVQEEAALISAPRAPVETRTISEEVATETQAPAAFVSPQEPPEAASQAAQKREMQSLRKEARQEPAAAAPPAPPPAAAPKAEDELSAVTTTHTQVRRLPASAAENARRATSAAADDAAREAELESPERWLARIRQLREKGKHEEAEAELARFREAYPTWSQEASPPRDER